eukprot:TCONS_00039801-protein
MLMGIHSLPQIPDYWSTHPFYHNPVYNSVMSRNRYQLISRFIHFNDNTNYDPKDPKRDRLFKIRPLLNYLNTKFQELYYPSRDVSIDEQLLLHKGNLHFKQYIPNKRARFGIKLFSLCDESGYVWSTEVYVGKNSQVVAAQEELKKLGISGQVVVRLMNPLLDKGHRPFTDNWYTGVPLFQYLQKHQTPACGTLRKNRG